MSTWLKRYLTLALLVTSAISLLPLSNAADEDGLPVKKDRRARYNEAGYVVTDAAGKRINYSKQDLLEQKAPAPSRKISASKRSPFMQRQPDWCYAAFGSGIGESNIVVAPNDGSLEIYVGGSPSTFGSDKYWYALRYDEIDQEYKQVFVSTYFSEGISRVDVGDVTGNSDSEILIALGNGDIHIYDQASKEWLKELNTSVNTLYGMAVADVDDDGQNEIVLTSDYDLYVFSGEGVMERHITGVGGKDVVVAQMDGDQALEIAVTDGNVVDTGTWTVQWTWSGGFGIIVEAADIDDDNMAELIAAESWTYIWAHDVDRQLPKWSISLGDLAAIHVADIDDDTVQEVLVGEGQWGDILAFDTVTLQQEWTIYNPEHGVTDVAVGDVDGDGTTEVLWGAGATSTGDDHLYVADWKTQQIEWQNVHLDGPFIGPETGDLDGDGLSEVVAVTWESESGYGSGRILVFDGQNGDLRALSDEIVGGLSWTGTRDLRLQDVDQDGRLEILVAADRLYDGVIEVYDFNPDNTFTLIWTNGTQPSSAFGCVSTADIDNDSELEVVGGSGGHLYVYDFNTGTEEWKSLYMSGTVTDLELVDADQDGTVELIGLVNDKDIYIFDGSTKVLETIIYGSYTDLECRTFDFNPYPHMILAEVDGDVSAQRYISGSYQEVFSKNFVSSSIDGISLGTAPHHYIWINVGDTLSFHDLLSGAKIEEGFGYGIEFGERMRRLPHPQGYAFLTTSSYAVLGFLRKK